MTRTRRFFNCVATCSPVLTISIMAYLAYYTQVNDNWSKIIPKMFGLNWLFITIVITLAMMVCFEGAALYDHIDEERGHVWRHARYGAYGRTVFHLLAVGLALSPMLSSGMLPGHLILGCTGTMLTSMLYYMLDDLELDFDFD